MIVSETAVKATCSFCKSTINGGSFVHTAEVSPKLIVDGLAAKPMFKGIASLIVRQLIWAPVETEICEKCFVEFASAMEPATGFTNALAASDGVNFFPVFVEKRVEVIEIKPDNDVEAKIPDEPKLMNSPVGPFRVFTVSGIMAKAKELEQSIASAKPVIVVEPVTKVVPSTETSVKTETPKAATPVTAPIPQRQWVEKPVLRSASQVANAILAGKAVAFSERTQGTPILTQCIVHRNATMSCKCGGWHDWTVMPALIRRPFGSLQAFGFGQACADVASAKIVEKGGKDPFIGAPMLDVAINGPRAVVTQPAKVIVEVKSPVVNPKSVTPVANTLSIVMRMFRITKPKQSDFQFSDGAMRRSEELKGMSKAFRTFRETPSKEFFSSMVRMFQADVAEGFDPMTMDTEDIKRVEQLAFGFGCEGENIGQFMEQADRLRTANGTLDLSRKVIGAKKVKKVRGPNATNVVQAVVEKAAKNQPKGGGNGGSKNKKR